MTVKGAGDDNADILRRMLVRGFDFSVPHYVEFFAVFPTPGSARVVAERYATDVGPDGESGWKVDVGVVEAQGTRLLTAKKMMLTHQSISRVEMELKRRVVAEGGRLDGWAVSRG